MLVLILVATPRLYDGFARLLRETISPMPPINCRGTLGAIDLCNRFSELKGWFAGRLVYSERLAVYPPASYALLWPLLGWLPFRQVQWLWAAVTAGGLAWLAALLARESVPASRLEGSVLALLPISTYAAHLAVVNGQLIPFLLPSLITGLLLLHSYGPGWPRDLLATAAILVALIKPTVAIPFMWLVLVADGGGRPALLIAGGYLTLTLVAAVFQPLDLVSLLRLWVTGAVNDTVRASRLAHGNLHSWLDSLGLQALDAPASLCTLAILGWWTYRCRHADLWLLLGVAALVARFWSFHFPYDDLLIAVPLVALIRMARRESATGELRIGTVTMLVLTSASILIPPDLFPAVWPVDTLLESGRQAVWAATLGVLVCRAWREAPRCPGIGRDG